MMHIVLVEPEIPGNTGNIARLCAATGSSLHLVRPLGFSLEAKYLKRAGLDYWQLLKIYEYDRVEEVLGKYAANTKFFLTTKARQRYTDVSYNEDSLLIFGKETAGLPQYLRTQYADACVRIPMIDEARSLNLANAVAIVTYEALRQQADFNGLKV